MKKILFIGYPTFDLSRKIVGGTELVNDTILNSLKSNYEVQYVVTKRVSSKLIEEYAYQYDCKVCSSKDYRLEDYYDYSPDLVITSMCNSKEDDIFNIVNQIREVPVWVYTHMSVPEVIDGYAPSFSKNNFYYSYLSEETYKVISQYISKDHIFKFYNPVVGNYKDERFSDYYNWDVLVNSRIVRQKGIDNSIELCNRLNWSTALIGSCSSMCRGLLKKYEKSFCHPDSQYLGTVDRLHLFEDLRRVKFTSFLPNGPEGFGLCLVESMSVGTPVITWKEFSDIVNPKYNILLNHSKYFIEEFVDEYLPKIDQYLDVEQRRKMRNEVVSFYGESAFKERLNSKISEIILRGYYEKS